jgi:shikimate kinase
MVGMANRLETEIPPDARRPVSRDALFHTPLPRANAAAMTINQPGAALAAAKPVTAAVETTRDAMLDHLGDRLIVLVGMMASGKTSVGKLLAQRLGIPFVDADHEIETAANMTIPEIFTRHGEADFRSGERRVIARLLRDGPRVLATGGGAFMNEDTRRAIAQRGIAIWLKADAETLYRRARRRSNRPLLQTDDPEATIRRLIEIRYPIYAEAKITIQSEDGPHDATVDILLAALGTYFNRHSDDAGDQS